MADVGEDMQERLIDNFRDQSCCSARAHSLLFLSFQTTQLIAW